MYITSKIVGDAAKGEFVYPQVDYLSSFCSPDIAIQEASIPFFSYLIKNDLKKIAILYHASCHDGVISAALTCQSIQNIFNGFHSKLDTFPASYVLAGSEDLAEDMLNELSKEYDVLIMVDFSVPADVAMSMTKMFGAVLILDHHQTALDTYKDLVFPSNTFAYITNAICATMLVYKFFDMPNQYFKLARLVNSYDMWTKEVPGTDAFIKSFHSNTKKIEDWLDYFNTPDLLDHVILDYIAKGSIRLEDLMSQVQLSVSKSWTTNLFKALGFENTPICFANPHIIGETQDALLDKYPNAKLVFVVTFSEMGRLKIRFGTRSNIDVSTMAKLYFKGGGHPKAASAIVDSSNPYFLTFLGAEDVSMDVDQPQHIPEEQERMPPKPFIALRWIESHI